MKFSDFKAVVKSMLGARSGERGISDASGQSITGDDRIPGRSDSYREALATPHRGLGLVASPYAIADASHIYDVCGQVMTDVAPEYGPVDRREFLLNPEEQERVMVRPEGDGFGPARIRGEWLERGLCLDGWPSVPGAAAAPMALGVPDGGHNAAGEAAAIGGADSGESGRGSPFYTTPSTPSPFPSPSLPRRAPEVAHPQAAAASPYAAAAVAGGAAAIGGADSGESGRGSPFYATPSLFPSPSLPRRAPEVAHPQAAAASPYAAAAVAGGIVSGGPYASSSLLSPDLHRHHQRNTRVHTPPPSPVVVRSPGRPDQKGFER